jgi:hypothetical protein
MEVANEKMVLKPFLLRCKRRVSSEKENLSKQKTYVSLVCGVSTVVDVDSLLNTC